MVGTIDGSNVPTGRWMHGPGPDEPLAQLLSPRRWLLADHQGSITAETDASGALVGTPYTYDPYGRPDAAHGFVGPRFRYTGQTAIVPTLPLWHYKARVYDPALGRFLQTDPIGYEDSLNLYQYVGNDPFNATDPTGRITADPGHLFDTPEAAARDAIRYINPKSIAENREYQGNIDRVRVGPEGLVKYVASYPLLGGVMGGATAPTENTVSDYHTHGDYALLLNGTVVRLDDVRSMLTPAQIRQVEFDLNRPSDIDYRSWRDGERLTRPARDQLGERYFRYIGFPNGEVGFVDRDEPSKY